MHFKLTIEINKEVWRTALSPEYNKVRQKEEEDSNSDSGNEEETVYEKRRKMQAEMEARAKEKLE